MAFYPDLETLLKSPDKDRLLDLRRSIRSNTGLIALFVVLIIVIYETASFLMNSTATSAISWGLMIRILCLLPAVVLLEMVRRYFNDEYLIGRDKITHYRGRISFHFATPAIRNIDLRAITVAQDIMGRMFDFGNVALATAAQEGPEIVMVGVRAPHELSRLIDQLRQQSQRATFPNATTAQANQLQSD